VTQIRRWHRSIFDHRLSFLAVSAQMIRSNDDNAFRRLRQLLGNGLITHSHDI
jgi:hypothetical protein